MKFKKLYNEWKWVVFALFAILTISFGIRFYNLTILPIFADEAIYIRWAQVMKSESTLRFLPLSDGKQPLSMWLMIPFLKFIEDPLLAGRLLSVLISLGTIVGVFFASYLVFKNKLVSILSSFAYAIVPFAVFFDRTALSDSTLTFFGIWVFVFGIFLTKKLRLDVAMILGFILGGALLTKSPALYFSLLLPTLVVLTKTKKEAIKYLLLLLPTYLIGYGIYNILRLGPNFHMLAIRNMDYVHPISHILTSPLDPFKPFIDRSKEFYMILGTTSLFFIWLFNYFVNIKSKFKEILILSGWFLGPILISSEFSKTMTARYVFFSLPFFVILAGSSFLTSNKNIKKLLYLLFALFIFQALSFDMKLLNSPGLADLPRSERSGYLEEWTAGQGIRETWEYLIKEKLENDNRNILVGTEGYFGTLPDGLKIYFDKDLNVNVIGIGLQLEEVPNSLIEAKKAGNDVYLLVNDERLNMDPYLAGLKLVKEFPKEIRPDNSHQSLLLFEITDETILKN